MSVECCECHGLMGHKDGQGVSHGICRTCMRKNHPGAFAMIHEREAMARGAEILMRGDASQAVTAVARIVAWDFQEMKEAA
jgi:hypothetical protein